MLKGVLTIKEILLRILLQIAIDEEKRKKALIFIVSVVTGILMLIVFFLYLITNPLDVFKQFIFGDEIIAIEQFQKDYGYNQSIGIYEKDYTGQIYDPIYMCNWSVANGYYAEGSGSYHSLIPNCAKAFGLLGKKRCRFRGCFLEHMEIKRIKLI